MKKKGDSGITLHLQGKQHHVRTVEEGLRLVEDWSSAGKITSAEGELLKTKIYDVFLPHEDSAPTHPVLSKETAAGGILFEEMIDSEYMVIPKTISVSSFLAIGNDVNGYGPFGQTVLIDRDDRPSEIYVSSFIEMREELEEAGLLDIQRLPEKDGDEVDLYEHETYTSGQQGENTDGYDPLDPKLFF